MSNNVCPNCYFKNESNSEFCQDCGAPLDLDRYIDSKKFNKNLMQRLRYFFGGKTIDDINKEVTEFINFSLDFSDYNEDLVSLKSGKLNKIQFNNKYKNISKLDDFQYLDEFNEDEDLNKKILNLKSIKTFINNFDNETDKIDKLLKDIDGRIGDIDVFDNDLNELLDSDTLLDMSNKNDLIQVHKSTFDFFDRPKVKELEIDSKEKILEFIDSYKGLDDLFEKHNEDIRIRQHDELILNCHQKASEFVSKISELKGTEDFLPSSIVSDIKNEFKESFDVLSDENISDLKISVQSKSDISKFLRDYKDLDQIIDAINEELSIRILQVKIDSNADKLVQFNNDLNYLLESNFFITFKQKDELIEHYRDLYDLVQEANEKIELNNDFKEFLEVYPKIDSMIRDRNEEYVQNELDIHKEFFDNIDGKSLDENQRLAVVRNELNSQIIAGAGCGKTLTVNAKVRYLIEKKNIIPSEILCLSFSNASVRDLEEKLPDGIEISTFHKLGGKILKANDKSSRPDSDALNNFVKIYFRDNVIKNEKLCEDLFEFYSYYFYTPIDEDEVDSLGEVYDIDESRDFKTLRELYGGEKEKITLKNETVKSLEELIISNYLFAHQIDYEYESVYNSVNNNFTIQKNYIYNLIFPDLSEYFEIQDILLEDLVDLFEIKEHILEKEYFPDFYLNDEDIYLEHFGVNKNCEALWLKEKEAQKYKDGIKWKRTLHRTYGSKLLETYSYYMSEDRLLQRLEEKLKKEGVEIKEINYEYLISKIVERDDVNRFKDLLKLIKNFIELFKGNDYTIDKFEEFRSINSSNPKIFERRRTELFLNIVEDIYISYQNYLKEIKKIDFNDMINNATREVEKGNLINNYKYIVIDEYQDTSYTRFNLIKAIQNKTGAKVCVVGDDWQSIYRFTGCDVSLFTQFENYFENPEKLSIETTYRNSQDLIDITGKFIKKNPNQINKSLNSKKEHADKPVKIAYYNRKSLDDKIKTLELIIDKISKVSDKIMIIGRNNFDICPFIDGDKNCTHNDNNEVIKPFKKGKNNELIYYKNQNLKIYYTTVHRSKGLEEDNVILINLENKRAGFPNQIEDDPILNLVINDSDQYEYSEERRLFYVGLTRTKNYVYLLVPETDKSIFVTELEENIEDLEIIDKQDEISESLDNPEMFMKDKKLYSITTPLKCPVCETGDVNLILLNKGKKSLIKFFTCSHEKCEWEGGFYYSDLELLDEIEICPECGSVMQVKNGRYGPFFSCSNRCKTPKITGEKLDRVNKIIEEMECNIEFESHESNLKCPKCGEGKVTLKINPENNNKRFSCSNDKCNWSGGKTTIALEDLDKIQVCPDCGGILVLRNGKRGPFLGCNNFPKCRHITNIDKENDEKSTKTKLTCPSCNKGVVLLKSNKFVCSECDWDGGTYGGNDLDSIEYCRNPDCNGITFMRDGRFGEFRSCSNYFKTKCDGGKNIKKSSTKKSKSKNENSSKQIKTKLKCPKCGSGDVFLNKNTSTGKGFFKCSSCDWDGGPFNQSEELLDSLDYCPVDGCMGLTFVKEGKYGPFKACTYYVKTKCNAGRK